MVTALFVVDFIYFHCRKLHERSLPRFTTGFYLLYFYCQRCWTVYSPKSVFITYPSHRLGCSYRPAVWLEYALYRLGMYTNIHAYIEIYIVSCTHVWYVSGPWKDARGIVVCIYNSKIQFQRELVIGANRHSK